VIQETAGLTASIPERTIEIDHGRWNEEGL